jgi:hypothetical protein
MASDGFAATVRAQDVRVPGATRTYLSGSRQTHPASARVGPSTIGRCLRFVI